LNGTAAREAVVGDLLIIAAYADVTDEELATWRPIVVLVDDHNPATLASINRRGRRRKA
jgi:aspartate 1-decarboxylase